jgi:hypothetical protein
MTKTRGTWQQELTIHSPSQQVNHLFRGFIKLPNLGNTLRGQTPMSKLLAWVLYIEGKCKVAEDYSLLPPLTFLRILQNDKK